MFFRIEFFSSLKKITYEVVKLGELPSPIAKHPLNGDFVVELRMKN